MALALQQNQIVPAHGWQALVKAVEALAAAETLGDIIAIVRTTARDISGADGVCFVLRDGDNCHYVEEDAIAPLWKGKRFPLSACISGWCMLQDAAAAIPDIYLDPRIPHDAYRPTFVKALVMVPVHSAKPIGAIGMYWAQTREFSNDELALIEALGRSTSAAVAASQLRQSLRESESRLSLALDAGGMGAWELNLATGELIATDVCKAIFGRDTAAPFSRNELLAAIHPDDRSAALEVFESGHNRDESYRIRCTDGGRHVELRGRVRRDAGGTPERVIGVVRDVTQRYQAVERLEALRAELFRTARLNDLGAMASALAHELNQPLAAASNYLHAAERLLGRDPAQALTAITKAESQFVRTRDIIQRIRGFVGQGQSQHTAEDVTQVCRDVLDLARMSPRYSRISIALDIEPDLPKADIDSVQIQQVLFNLLRNAVDATADADDRRVVLRASQHDGMIAFAVADHGPGLAPQIAEHLFQPFHTTKEDGMGVGLSLCRKIVETHGGKLWHEPGNPGATFVFTVPVRAE